MSKSGESAFGEGDGNESSGGQIPSGVQVARAIPDSAEFGKAGTGTEQVGILFKIVSGPFKGRTLPWYGAFTEKATERTIEQLVLAGCTFPSGDLTDLTGLGSKDLEVQVDCDEHPESGELRSRISWLGVGVAMKEKLDEGGKAALNKANKGTMNAVLKKLGIKKSANAAPAVK